MASGSWCLYIVECADASLYTGISTDVVGRVVKHNSGRGAKYTRSRTPVRLVYVRECGTQSIALKEEARVKKLSRSDKIAMISGS